MAATTAGIRRPVHRFTACSTPPPGPPPRSTAAGFHRIRVDHTIRSIAVAEQLLRDALVLFQPLADRRITSREDFGRHLDHLKALLVRRRVHVAKSANCGLQPGLLSPWRETEQALGVSESSRKAKVGILRLDPDVQE